MCVLQWSSLKIGRFCRSTVYAGGQSAHPSVEHGDYLKILSKDAFDQSFHLAGYRQKSFKRTGILVVDAKSFCDYLHRDNGHLRVDKGFGEDLRLLQTSLAQAASDVRWASGPQQLADSLTQDPTGRSYLRLVLEHRVYQLHTDKKLEEEVNETLGALQEKIVQDATFTKED